MRPITDVCLCENLYKGVRVGRMAEEILQHLHHVRVTPTVHKNITTKFLPSLEVVGIFGKLRGEYILRKGRATSYVSFGIVLPKDSERKTYAKYE